MNQLDLLPSSSAVDAYITVILPLALPKLYTYEVPIEFSGKVKTGVRVEVQFGKKNLYSGLVYQVSDQKPDAYTPKPITAVLDENPVVTMEQLQFWEWLSKYYCCTMGEVMNAALPSGLKLASETRIILSPLFDENFTGLTDKEYLIVEALSIQNELTISDIQKILQQKSVYPLIKSLLEKRIVYLHEELKHKYKPKLLTCVRLAEPYRSDSKTLQNAFEQCKRAQHQEAALLSLVQLSRDKKPILKSHLCKMANVQSPVIKALEKKEIVEIYKMEVSRVGGYEDDLIDTFDLAEQQEQALEKIQEVFKEKNIALLHGVTGSGKTRVYVELIQKAIQNGEQVLYLLPEIALTAQIVHRLQKIFGDKIAVYHSRLSNNERVDMWKAVLNGKSVVLGARSSLFLPFKNLKLIIIDEEHDPSFKQNEPAPRYNARDAAIYMAHLQKAKVLLGTATPSIETYHNVKNGKYALIEMPERFGGLKLPEIIIADVKEEMQKRKLQSHFTTVLLDHLKTALENGEQAILFQNRRGYAPQLRCETCGWTAECIHCDVGLTYHKFTNNLRCHYCGFQTKQPTSCPACGVHKLTIKGFGTEKIEDELKIYLPEAKIARMDFDTVRTKNAHSKLISDFEEKRVDILVGTQMVTKGLDFDNVGIVGVLSADHLLYFPDFRATERAFQLMTQVSGRAGRKHKQGKVIIQAFNTSHPVLPEVIQNNFSTFLDRELKERYDFNYPPFCRLIRIQLKHKKKDRLLEAGKIYFNFIKEKLKHRIIGPAEPGIPRVRSYYLLDILLKLERKKNVLEGSKKLLLEAKIALITTKGFSNVKVNIDVDPY